MPGGKREPYKGAFDVPSGDAVGSKYEAPAAAVDRLLLLLVAEVSRCCPVKRFCDKYWT